MDAETRERDDSRGRDDLHGQNGIPHRNGSRHANEAVDKLFQQAMLNAMSVLEEEEFEAFEAALRAAPHELRAQLIRQEAFAADFRDTLPDAEPPAALRQRVRAAVEAANASNASRERAHGPQKHRRPASGRAAGASAALGSVLFRGRRVNHLWRSVSIGLLVAVVGMGTLQFHVIKQTAAATDLAATGELLDRLGPSARNLLLNDNVEQLRLTATPAAGDAVAVLWRDTDDGTGRLVCADLEPASGVYRVVALDKAGRIERELAELQSTGPIAGASVPALPRGTTLAVLPPAGMGDSPVFTLAS